MHQLADIPVQKLFVITIVLKIAFSALGWKFSDPWILGMVFPILIMGAYIVLGLRRSSSDVSDEKFADSCYYLGFIFTITSIIFSLFDLPNIDTKMSEIAARFGTAMLTTVIGLGVRVYLVGFRKEISDAMEQADSAIIAAADRMREHFTIAYEKLKDFESNVDESTKLAVARVEIDIEKMTKSYGERLTSFFEDLAQHNHDLSTKAFDDVQQATRRLSMLVDNYARSLAESLQLLQAKVSAFSDAVERRLDATTFPDDYFSKQLAEPVAHLRTSTTEISSGVAAASEEVRQSGTVLAQALKTLRSKSANVESALDRVTELANTQAKMTASSQQQLTALAEMSEVMRRLGTSLQGAIDRMDAQETVSRDVAANTSAIAQGNARTLEFLAQSLASGASVAEHLPKMVELLDAVARQLDKLDKRLAEKFLIRDPVSVPVEIPSQAIHTDSMAASAPLNGIAHQVPNPSQQEVDSHGHDMQENAHATSRIDGAAKRPRFFFHK